MLLRRPLSLFIATGLFAVFFAMSTCVAQVLHANSVPTTLELRLVSVNIGAHPMAIIEDLKTHQQNAFELNDKVKGAQIVAIRKDEVLLWRSGKYESLSLKGRYKKTPQDSDQGMFAQNMSPVIPAEEEDSGPIVLPQSTIDAQWSQFPTQVFQAGIVPAIENGETVGLTVSNVPENSIISLAGFQPGDTLKSINGRSFQNPFELLKYLNSSEINPSEISIEIERGGNRKVLNLATGQ